MTRLCTHHEGVLAGLTTGRMPHLTDEERRGVARDLARQCCTRRLREGRDADPS